MNKKKKGSDAERALIHALWSNGWAAHRIAGSGSSKYPSPDIIAGNALRRLAIECKVTKDKAKYFAKEEVDALKVFATHFGAEAWLAIKFPKKEWVFLSAEDAETTGKMWVVTQEIAERRGFSLADFDEKQP